MMKYRFLPIFLLTCCHFVQTFSQTDCTIFNGLVLPQSCEDGMFMVDIFFEVENPGGAQFGILGNGTNYGLFNYEDLPVTLGPLPGDGETDWFFIIYDLEEPMCQTNLDLGVISCCGFEHVLVSPGQCNNTSNFSLTLDFDTTGVSGDGFIVFDGSGSPVGNFLYSDLPVTVPAFPANGNQPDVMEICDNADPNCCRSIEFDGPDCDPDDCEIYDLDVSTSECTSGEFFAILNFTAENTSTSFTVSGNGNFYGTYQYADLPVEVGPLTGDGETVYTLLVQDAVDPECSGATELTAVDCPDVCAISNVVATPIGCNGDSAYILEVDFDVFAPGEEGFTVSTMGTSLGSFAYADLPIIIDSVPASGNLFDAIRICDNADTLCCMNAEFLTFQCDDCIYWAFDLSFSACNAEGAFFFTVDFEYQNTSDSFRLFGNQTTYGIYGYDELPVTVGPLPGDGTTFYEIAAIDLENQLTCFSGVEIGTIDCTCELDTLEIDTAFCNNPESLTLTFDFAYANTDTVGFEVYANGDFLGLFPYDSLPLTIDSFPISGGPTETLEVCAYQNPTCCAVVTFDALDCGLDTCSISDVLVQTIGCTSDSTYAITVNFGYEEFPGSTFEVSTGGISLGQYPIAILPVTVAGFPAHLPPVVRICAVDDTTCCAVAEFEGLECPECPIFSISGEAGECVSDSTFRLFLSLTLGDDAPDSLLIRTPSDTIGTFDPLEVPSVFEEFPLPDGDSMLLIACAANLPACCDSTLVALPDCSDLPCEIRDVFAGPGNCTSDSTVSFTLNFMHENLDTNLFELKFNNIVIDTYDLALLPLTIEDLPTYGGGEFGLSICPLANPECCYTDLITTPDCDTIACSIFNLTAEPSACLTDSSFSLFVNFDFFNAPGSGFNFFANEALIGFFPKSNIPEIISFPLPASDTAELRICDNTIQECCASVRFIAPDCDCPLENLGLLVDTCTSDTTFAGTLLFDFGESLSDSFEIYLGNQLLSTVSADTFPFSFDAFPSDTSQMLEITLCETGQEGCCITEVFEVPDCSLVPCVFSDFRVTASECDSNAFMVLLEFEHSGTGNIGFSVSGNGDQYGIFPYDTLPLVLGPFDGDGVTPWEFLISDVGNPFCFELFELGTVLCEVSSVREIPEDMAQITYSSEGISVHVWRNDLDFSLYNMLGHQMQHWNNLQSGSVLQILRGRFVPGVYVLSVQARDRQYASRVLIAR